MSKRKPDPFDLTAALKARDDIEFEANTEHTYFTDDLCRYRILSDRIQIGVRSTFDRWANSVDFWCNIPSGSDGLNALFVVARKKATTKPKDDFNIGEEEDIQPSVRKQERAPVENES